MPTPQESRGNRDESADQTQIDPSHRTGGPGVWPLFGLFVLGFLILVVESKFTLPVSADYALKGVGGAFCLLAVVWIRRQARKSGLSRRVKKNE